MNKQKYQAYAAATQTVAKTKQIVMVYDAAIRSLQQAREAIRENRIEDRFRALTKAGNVLIGLQGALDFENGGDIARVLYQFYSGIHTRIQALHRNNNLQECEAIIAELKQMREVWQEIDDSMMAEAAGQAAPEEIPENPGSDEQNVTLSA